MTLDTIPTGLFFIATALYTASTVGYALYLFMQKEKMQHTALSLILAGFIFHAMGTLMVSVQMGTLPIHNLKETLSIAALALSGMFLVLKTKFNLKILGIFAAPLVALMMMAMVALPGAPVPAGSFLKGFWLVSHIILIFSGEAALALACGAGILYILQENAIKAKKRGFFFTRLPSLDLLDSTSYTCVITGFAMLTAGLITGLVYAKAVWGSFWTWDPKEIWSAVTWLVYAALLHGRLTSGWQGRRSAIMTIIGFAVLVFTFLGVNFLIGGHHRGFTM
ncbi:cytochrome c-type biogenesis protein CcsB [Desulfocicer vacuolatum DSM 3385]|uniref:Cytochrome c-type biogenesis protein CcsB n=1 Tax=Desulfocicer vacuolatum DSM 3385 TaxID=1121400 RepID=A0A1W2E4J6_9BACT|nr:c-type cytochrome biogenesis protein CcsB [Desulfocicer vacuolatum]SMD04674.1 cytochrome c-type biogenesis protein CcsB [Desulfocicer vacuolatum DSM 3385]